MRLVTLAFVGALMAGQVAHAAAPLDLVGPISDYKIYVSERRISVCSET